MGSAKPPDPVTPGEAAQAAMGTAAAGEMMSVANQPVDQYGNLVNTIALGPAAMQVQQSLAGRAAKQGAQQQMDIQSSVDPQALCPTSDANECRQPDFRAALWGKSECSGL